jgi:ATP-dependent DNA helicase RecG
MPQSGTGGGKSEVDSSVTWNAPLTVLKGVGSARAEAFAAVGICNIGHLLTFYPYRYKDRPRLHSISELDDGAEACLRVRITGRGSNFYRGRMKLTRVPAMVVAPCLDDDATDQAQEPRLTLRWFNQPYRKGQFAPGTEIVIAGRLHYQNGKTAIVVQECELANPDPNGPPGLGIGRLVPVYSNIAGVSAGLLRKLIRQALDRSEEIPEALLPPALARKRGLIPLQDALWRTHFPESHRDVDAARKRLTYQELFLLQVELARRHRAVKKPSPGYRLAVSQEQQARYLDALPFEITGAQRRVLAEISEDLSQAAPAHRLVHGDVGSGKTAIAAWALYCAVEAGKQAALMAPTELLAEQHFRALRSLLMPLGIESVLLTGSLAAEAKDHVRQRLADGEPVLVIGTHALFQESVVFANLSVAVIDEQHRFGLQQRAALAAKGLHPNVIVMSATPIPRTLALTLYGEFDVSVIDELPPGRQPVATKLLAHGKRVQALKMVVEELAAGHQAYVVCPLVAEGGKIHAEAATRMYQRLGDELAELSGSHVALGLVHGQIPAEQREEVMEEFRAGKIQVLVSTTVIEVGVDVPNATAMVIFNAERFGLAQLHQLRGRVARSSTQARCVLITGSNTPEVIERLRVLEATSDGFQIAEEDLLRRGPGELVGLAQHGLPDVHMAALVANTATLVQAREDACELLACDPKLSRPEHQVLRNALKAVSSQPREWTI